MKQINLFMILLLVAFMGAASIVNAQLHPLAFGPHALPGGTTTSNPNWYGNYVGLRFDVTAPAAVAGPKLYTTANDGLGTTGDWGGVVTTPITNVPVIMGIAADTSGCTVFTAGSMTGLIALLWRGPIVGGTPCDFSLKALNAQNAGAIACVLINEYPGQGPVGMGAGGSAAGVTIPVFMIGNLDGLAIEEQYNALPAGSVKMSITPWGQDLQNDLGFVPTGPARWHNYAIPSNQLGATGNPATYNMLDGAFIANYGINPATNIKLSGTTSFTPTGGIATVQHTDTVVFEGPFYDDTLTAHNAADSIMAMFRNTEYALNASGPGQFTTTYTISSDSIDQYPGDNTTSVSFYVTDSVYSKGTYDFTNNQPSFGLYEQFGGGNEFIWGPMYYVANAGTALSSVQYSLAMNSGTSGYPYLPGSSNIYVFQWTDGELLADGNSFTDSIVEDGELNLVAVGVKTYNGTTDTTGVLLWQQIYADTTGSDSGPQLLLAANSWYYVAVDVTPPSTAVPIFLGCDGNINPYPRIYGRYQANVGASGNHLLDYSNMVFGSKLSLDSFQDSGNFPVPEGQTFFVNSVDSFVYNNMNGLIPAVAMIANNHPTTAVKNVGKPLADVTLYPNPAKDQMNVAVTFDKNEPTVSYEIIDGLARFVSKETHNNVQSETYTVNTSKLAAGNYYLIINADGRAMSKKFVVIK